MKAGVTVHLKKEQDDSYDIVIGNGILPSLGHELSKRRIGSRYAVITDTRVARLWAKPVLSSLRKERLAARYVTFQGREASKNLAAVSLLLEKLSWLGLDRSSCVIALGGGVVGDVAGFVAATYMRGIPLVQVPTTLLAMADSSVGGKTGVDLHAGKNLAGAFHQPRLVFIDVCVLSTLPKKELRSGMAEVIKHAVIGDAKMFSLLEQEIERVYALDMACIGKLVKRNCAIKARIVEQDERECNLRKIANYGHTIGHALESLTAYRRYSHGEAIAIGMAAEALIAEKQGVLSAKDRQRQNALLRRAGFDLAFPKDIAIREVLAEIRKDKKAIDKAARFALPAGIGMMHQVKGRFGIAVDERIVRSALEESR
ncbi:TPA: 3-dehydroquinate synthase [Candidatus Woesearchaeota archaeon]|nr:3-dehydroquinate synthase [Candidatus Woesearchaeota archaeon]HII69565.1 3-dehydroquinate synthase [Candidatus Woesearchaeota archaeon]